MCVYMYVCVCEFHIVSYFLQIYLLKMYILLFLQNALDSGISEGERS